MRRIVLLSSAALLWPIAASAESAPLSQIRGRILEAIDDCRYHEARTIYDSEYRPSANDESDPGHKDVEGWVVSLNGFWRGALASDGPLTCEIPIADASGELQEQPRTCHRFVRANELLRIPAAATCADVLPVVIVDTNADATLTLAPTAGGDPIILAGENRYVRALPAGRYSVTRQCAGSESELPAFELQDERSQRLAAPCSILRVATSSKATVKFREQGQVGNWRSLKPAGGQVGIATAPGGVASREAEVEAGWYEVAFACHDGGPSTLRPKVKVAPNESKLVELPACFDVSFVSEKPGEFVVSPQGGEGIPLGVTPGTPVSFPVSTELNARFKPHGEQPYAIDYTPEQTRALYEESTPEWVHWASVAAATLGVAAVAWGWSEFEDDESQADARCGGSVDACPASQRDAVEDLRSDSRFHSGVAFAGGGLATAAGVFWLGACQFEWWGQEGAIRFQGVEP